MTAARPTTVLIVEDDPGIAELERSRLAGAGYRSVVVDTAEAAMMAVVGEPIDLLLLDYRLANGGDGLDLYARIRAAGFDPPVILVTGFGNEAVVIQALRLGVRDVVSKSLEYLDYLPEAVGRVLRQVRTERQLTDSEARLTALIGTATDAIIVVESDGTVSLFNPAAERMFRRPAGAALGRPLREFIPPDPTAPVGAPASVGPVGLRAGAGPFPIDASVSRGVAGGREFFTVVARDVTERVRAEAELQMRDRAIRAVSQGILITDPNRPDNPIVYASPGFERMTGYTAADVVGRNCRLLQGERTDPAAVAVIRAAVRTRATGQTELVNYRKDGSPFWNGLTVTPVCDPDGVLTHFVGVLTDVTDRRHLLEQLQQAQKMEAVGQLAGGVAHDFNNLLTIISGYSGLLLADLPPEAPARSHVEQIYQAGERAALLTRQLLTFSRKEVVEVRSLDLSAVVGRACKLIRRLIGEDIRVDLVLPPLRERVMADAGQIEQVVMNLALNARDAMPQGGRLTIATGLVTDEIAPEGGRPGAPARRYVRLTVSDTGTGMSDAVRERIFEPFYTTKAATKGTGLGLSTVYGIVQQAGGRITVESALGRGTTFAVDLPVAQDPVDQPEVAPDVTAPGGTETVLVVEDDDQVRLLTRESLRSLGYVVLEARGGDDAIRVMGAYPGAIHLLLTDVIMPGMSGFELAKAIQTARPDCRVLYASGYTADAVTRHAVDWSSTAYLQKPFTAADLARKVREALGQ